MLYPKGASPTCSLMRWNNSAAWGEIRMMNNEREHNDVSIFKKGNATVEVYMELPLPAKADAVL